jgi:hypothetical protein
MQENTHVFYVELVTPLAGIDGQRLKDFGVFIRDK